MFPLKRPRDLALELEFGLVVCDDVAREVLDVELFGGHGLIGRARA